jgi:5-methylcytosine-specific restriction endonuclease McrA
MKIGKTGRIRVSEEEYEKLRQEVLKRDGWKCQMCGSSKDIHVHHIDLRSRMGSDLENNLISLCARCHRAIHEDRLEDLPFHTGY